MSNENYRDYVLAAFRYYAFCGKPDSDAVRQLRTATPTEMRGALSDLEAVLRTIERLKTEPDGRQSLDCLDRVYFAAPARLPKRNELSQRIAIAANDLGMSESSVHRRLRRVRLLMAMERGLRIEESELARFLS